MFIGNYQIGDQVTIDTNIYPSCRVEVYSNYYKLFDFKKFKGQSSFNFFLDQHTFGHIQNVQIFVGTISIYEFKILEKQNYVNWQKNGF